MGLAQSEKRGGVVGRVLHGHLQALDSLLRRGRIGAANVVFKGAELDAAGSSEKGLLGYVEVRIDLAGDLPCDGVFNVEEASEFAGVLERLRRAAAY